MSLSDEQQVRIRQLLQQVAKMKDGEDFLRDALWPVGLGLRSQVETMASPSVNDPERLANARTAIILDSETTGVDHKSDGVTQLAMMKVTFDEQGILSFGDRFDRLRDPGIPIPQEVVELTGITDEMVKGQAISNQEVADFVGDAETFIAHNAAFDRKFVEATFQNAGFDDRRWDCSHVQIDWKTRGFRSASLEMIALGMGLVYGAHNAMNDILALGHVLGMPGRDGASTAFAEMWSAGFGQTMQIMATQSPFHSKDKLKERGYKWSDDGSESFGIVKTWHRTIPATAEAMEEECQFLRSEVFGKDVGIPCFRLDPAIRYSARSPHRDLLRTAEPKDLLDAIAQVTRENGQMMLDM